MGWNGMEWNGMGWNGMEWNDLRRRVEHEQARVEVAREGVQLPRRVPARRREDGGQWCVRPQTDDDDEEEEDDDDDLRFLWLVASQRASRGRGHGAAATGRTQSADTVHGHCIPLRRVVQRALARYTDIAFHYDGSYRER